MDKMTSENKPSVWKNVVRATTAVALGVGAAVAEVKPTNAAGKDILNFGYSPALEMNVGHVAGIELINNDALYPGEITLQNQIIDEALEAGIPPRSVAILRVESDIAADQHLKGRGGDARGGTIALLQEEGNGNFWIVGEKNPGGSVGAIKDPAKTELSMSPLEIDAEKFPGKLIAIDSNGSVVPVVSVNRSPEAGYVDAGIFVEGVNDGERIERTMPFGHWSAVQLASLNLPGPIKPMLEAATPSPEPTTTPEVKTYEQCKIREFYKCEVPEQDLWDGNYLRWLDTLSQPFDQTKIKDVPFVLYRESAFQADTIIYDPSTAPNFTEPSTVPFRRNVTSGIVWYDDAGRKSFAIIKPIEFFDKNDPTHNKWVIVLESYYYRKINPTKDVDPINNQYVRWGIDTWLNKMNITPILTTFRTPRTGTYDPLAKRTFESIPDINERITRFIAGDVSALSAPGIVLLTAEVDSSIGTYK
jgi:hypothetical protein